MHWVCKKFSASAQRERHLKRDFAQSVYTEKAVKGKLSLFIHISRNLYMAELYFLLHPIRSWCRRQCRRSQTYTTKILSQTPLGSKKGETLTIGSIEALWS